MEKKKILVVEDLEMTRDIITASFENEYELSEAENGLEALNILKKDSNFNLILLDLNMPIMNGESFLFAKSMMDDIKKIPVVIISVDNDKQTMHCFLNNGANAYMPKPLDIDELKTIVKDIIDKNVEYTNQDSIYKY